MKTIIVCTLLGIAMNTTHAVKLATKLQYVPREDEMSIEEETE